MHPVLEWMVWKPYPEQRHTPMDIGNVWEYPPPLPSRQPRQANDFYAVKVSSEEEIEQLLRD